MAKHDNSVVCIVDDDESLRRSLRNLLSSVGYRVATFDSAEAFLESEYRATPCCLVLDLRMPGMGGLALLSHLTSTGSGHRTIVLTGHGDEVTRRRSLLAGAIAFLEKPFQADELLDAVEEATSTLALAVATTSSEADPPKQSPNGAPMVGSDRPNQFGSGHICAFFNNAEEEHQVLRAFVKEGLDRGERNVHIVDPEKREDHLRWLRDEGIDVDQAMATGQLEVRPWDDAYLRGDRFDQHTMLAEVAQALQGDGTPGSPRTRILAHMEWALLEKAGVEDLVEYEARASTMLCSYPAPAICAYDLSKFSASVVMDVLRTHPMVIIGGVLQENPFFVPPEQFLLEIKSRQSGREHATVAS